MPYPQFAHLVDQTDLADDMYGFRSFETFSQNPAMVDPEGYWGLKEKGLEMPPWLDDVHNRYTGRCFVFGTGPSLVEQLDLLKQLDGEPVITCNRMRNWKDFPLTPFIHCVTEPHPVLNFGRRIAPYADFPGAQNKVVCMWWRCDVPGWLYIPKAPDDIQVRWQGAFGMGDHLPPIPTAWASPLTISQLLLWMGFTEIIILGCDTTQEGQAWDPKFGRTQQPRNIRSIVESADRLRAHIQKGGRQIWDATPGGRLNREGALPYRDLAEILADGS